jgi:hypothetical protein
VIVTYVVTHKPYIINTDGQRVKIVFIPKSELTKLGLEDYEAMCTEEESSCSDDEEDNEGKQPEQSDDDESM